MGWSLQAANDCLPLWCILRSPKHWSWISCWNFVNFLPHHLLYLPESKKIILCATLYWDLYQRKELAAPTNTQHLKGITGLQTGLLDKNTRQSCIFLALMPNLKFDAVKTWQFLSDAPRTTQKFLILKNLLTLPAHKASGNCLDGVSTHRQKQMH